MQKDGYSSELNKNLKLSLMDWSSKAGKNGPTVLIRKSIADSLCNILVMFDSVLAFSVTRKVLGTDKLYHATYLASTNA